MQSLDNEQPITLERVAAEISASSPRIPAVRLNGRLATLIRHREVRRIIAFLFAGGLSALITISTTAVLTDVEHQRFFWSALIGTEVGILVNFAINDRLAFRDLSVHRRPVLIRLLRFHVTCATGQTVIFLTSLFLHDVAHWRVLFAQGLPIGMVTVLNFAMHRFWTYRGSRKIAGQDEIVRA